MKSIYFCFFLLVFKDVYGQSTVLSSLLIYEKNGKSILLIKAPLTALDSEIKYIHGENTPPIKKNNQLLIQHFKKNCFVIVNGDTIKFSNIRVQLGYEVNLFAELDNVPKIINTLHVKVSLFKDISNNICKLIITNIMSLPQKQYFLSNSNLQEVNLKVENNEWIVEDNSNTFSRSLTKSIIFLVFLFLIFIIFK